MTLPKHQPHRLVWPLLAAALVVSWSSGFVGIRYASESADVMLVLFWRTLMSGLVLLPFALMVGPRIDAGALMRQMAFGVAMMFLYLGGFALAIGQRVPTGLVALISDLVPLAIAALSQPVLGHRLTSRQWTGTALGVAGVLIVSLNSLSLGTAPAWAYMVTIASMMVFALATVLQKRMGTINMPIHQSLCLQCLTAAIFFAACAEWNGGLMPPLDGRFEFGIAWLVLFSTFFCYGVYYASLRLYSAAQVSSVIYLSPPVTMLWAWLLFGEPLSLAMVLGLAVTLFGVWLTSSRGTVSKAGPRPVGQPVGQSAD
ncbi:MULTISPECIES: DMT family transporter [unclassified Mesorhizobium]|uniref:DMT family transporter n=1 Tax=unclassified Mesorhizobium TaxID=325217 RepID=UPI000F764A00|nr:MULTISPECIES: DMT family transporter [unclassified Mesorhizobium]AZO53746.1 DMT family transporter [Mesorhizobium sp. M8A.F.Ca.ET.057.01.1.1]RWE46047.1 MAG: DMT family transporter [Mesorhizobium sp.]